MSEPIHQSFLEIQRAEMLGWKPVFCDTDARCGRLSRPVGPVTFVRGKTFLWLGRVKAAGDRKVWQCFELEGGRICNLRLYHDLDSAFTKEAMEGLLEVDPPVGQSEGGVSQNLESEPAHVPNNTQDEGKP